MTKKAHKRIISIIMIVVMALALWTTGGLLTPAKAVVTVPIPSIIGKSEHYPISTPSIKLSQEGYYYIEAWGGNGGSGGDKNTIATTGRGTGGTGGLSTVQRGLFFFQAGTTIYIQVGTAGGNALNIGDGLNTSNSGGSPGFGNWFGTGYEGADGGNATYTNGQDAAGGGGGGAASGVLLNTTSIANILLASGGGGGGGGAVSITGITGDTGGNGNIHKGYNWSPDTTNGYIPSSFDSTFPRYKGQDGAFDPNLTALAAGGGGGGGGGFNGCSGGGGRGGSGGAISNGTSYPQAGSGGGGGQNYCGGSSYIPSVPAGLHPIPNNSRTSNRANGEVYITYLGFAGSETIPLIENTLKEIEHTTSAQTTFFEFRAKKTGFMELELKSAGTGSDATVTLFGDDGTMLSNEVHVKELPLGKHFVTFGVAKGKTYELKVVQNAPTEATNGMYSACIKNQKANASGGKSIKKAKKLAKKKTITGSIVAGNNEAKWHKFKVTDKKVTLTVKGNTNKNLKCQLILKKGKKTKTFKAINLPRSGQKGFQKKPSIKGYKGWTCYIKVYPADNESSGWYSVKWN